MSNQEIRIECMSELFYEQGIAASTKQIEQIIEGFALHLEMENESASYQHVDKNPTCEKCEKHKKEIIRLKLEVGIYNEHIVKANKLDFAYIKNGKVEGKYPKGQ